MSSPSERNIRQITLIAGGSVQEVKSRCFATQSHVQCFGDGMASWMPIDRMANHHNSGTAEGGYFLFFKATVTIKRTT